MTIVSDAWLASETTNDLHKEGAPPFYGVEGHDKVTAQPGAQDQPKRSVASADKLIVKKPRPSEAYEL